MNVRRFFTSLPLFAGLILAAGGLFLAPAATHAEENRVTFFNSGATLRPTVAATARALEAKDLAGNLDFSVALQMRDFAGLEARVAKGEVISRQELEQRYLPLEADYQAIRAWLVSQGITVTSDDGSRLGVFARGTVAQVQAALQVSMVKVTYEGVDYPAANGHPSLPAGIAAAVLGVNGLHPYHHLHRHSRLRPQGVTHQAFPSAGYLIDNILTTYDAAPTGLTGAGQTIAILIDATPLTSDLTKFWTTTGNYTGTPQTTSNVTTINVNNTTITTRELEETLDVEWSGGIAPGAKVRVYACGAGLTDTQLDNGLKAILADAKTDPTIHQLSISLGEGETYETDSTQFTTDHNYFTALASQGVSVFVSSGDGGSTPDDTGKGDEDTGPMQVEYYSSDTSVTAVGGTSLQVSSTTNFARSSETAWIGSGGGVSVEFTKPSWQTGTGVPSGTGRYVPDVALPADPNTGAYLYYSGSATVIGGTSWAAPTWAGFCALINEARANAGTAGGIGLLNPSLYPLIGTTNFYDITSGNNAEGSKAAGKYATATGYDPVTGIGVPDVKLLVTALGGTTTAPAPTLTSFTPTSGAAGTSVTITGTNFAPVTSVSFNGTAAIITAISATQVVATVPAGATTGKIGVTTTGGTATSTSSFTVTTSGGTTGGGGSVVISQVYGGSGTSTSSYQSDYIELFNPGMSAVDLSNYSVQYASATGTSYQVNKLTGSIAAQHYYLLKESTSSTGLAALPTADFTGTINLSATAGKVALVNTQTALSGSGASTGATVVDYVGYGTTASEYKGSGPAPAPSATTADLRGNGGYTNTGVNSTDFTAATPNPRNSSTANPSTAPDLTITLTHTGSFTQADTGDIYTITVSNGGTAATTGVVNVADTVPGGLTATAISGTGWTATSTTAASRSDAIAAGGSYPTLTLTINVSSTAPASVVNAVAVSGGGETNTANNSASDATTITALTPSQSWRYTYFGTTADTGNAADTANPAGDGIDNLLKYTLGLNPLKPTISPIMVDISTGYLRMTVPRSSSATDVALAVQVNGNLTNASGWTTLTNPDQNTPTLLQAHDSTAVSSGGDRFIRLLVTRP